MAASGLCVRLVITGRAFNVENARARSTGFMLESEIREHRRGGGTVVGARRPSGQLGRPVARSAKALSALLDKLELA